MTEVHKPSMSFINAVDTMCQGQIHVIICAESEFAMEDVDKLIGLNVSIIIGSDIAYGLNTLYYRVLVGKIKGKTDYFISDPFYYCGAKKDDENLRKKFGFKEETFISLKLREWILLFYLRLIFGEVNENYILNGTFMFNDEKPYPDTVINIDPRSNN